MPIPVGSRPTHVVGRPLLPDVVSWSGPSAKLDAPDQADVVVTGIELDSRAVAPGDLYAALPGAATHGARFVDDVAAAGAVAVLTDPTGLRLVREASGAGARLPVVVVPDARAVVGPLAARVYGDPAQALLMFGVTGTNGKTTTSYLLDSVLRAAGRTTGLLGTVETRVAQRRLPSARTTPEAPTVHALLAVMREHGASAATMEVSSHGLALHRVDGVRFDVAGFTNLSQDHLDFHATMQGYFEAKARLFTPQHCRRGVICVDDPWGRRLAETAEVPVVTLATVDSGTATAEAADWTVTEHRPDASGTAFVLVGPGGERLTARCPLPGAFNVQNAALALVMLIAAGEDPQLSAQRLALASAVPGRMEVVPGTGTPGEPLVVVDYAHTPDAVDLALSALRPAADGPLVIVLGAGGDRDRAKRGPMGAAAARVADVVVITDDNPRSEDPADIRAAVRRGAEQEAVRSGCEVLEVSRRRRAVAQAIGRAWGGGTVLVAGKGHEQGQEVAGVVHAFDDRVVAGEALREAAASHDSTVRHDGGDR